MMQLFLTFFYFVALCFFSFYVPGHLLLRFLKVNSTKTERYILPWFTGISLFLIINYLFAWINLSFLYLYILMFLNIVFLFIHVRHLPKAKPKRIDYWSLALVVLGSIAFSFSMFFSGMVTSDGMRFIGVNSVDGIRHIAYIKNMNLFFPPQHPGLSGMELKGFHYFYDFMLSRFSLFFHLGAEDLYFRLFPIFTALLYGGGFYLLAKKLVKSVIAIRLILFFAYFAQSFSFPAVLFSKILNITNFPVIQLMSLMINPFTVLSIAILTASLSMLPDIKKSYKYGIIVGLLLGPLSQMKVYAGLIGIAAVSLYSLYLFVRYKTRYLVSSFTLLFTVAVLTAITFLPNNFKQGGLVFYPLEFYRHYISGTGFENLHWDLRRIIFMQHNNYLRIAILYVEAILIFWFLNLGLRIIILLKTRELFKKRFWLNDFSFIFFIAFLTPILIGSLFIQSVSVFDTVQFFWIVFALLAVPSGIVFGEIINKMKKFKYLLIILIVLFSIPGNVDFLIGYMPIGNAYFIPSSDLHIYKQIDTKIKKEDFVVYIPKKDPETLKLNKSITPVVSAMLGRSIYLDYGNLPFNAKSIYDKRARDVLALDDYLVKCDVLNIRKELKKIGTRYVLTANKYECLDRPSMTKYSIVSNNLSFYVID